MATLPESPFENHIDEASQIWDKVMEAVEQTIVATIQEHVPHPAKEQLDFWHDMAVEQLYHAGWNAVRKIADQNTRA